MVRRLKCYFPLNISEDTLASIGLWRGPLSLCMPCIRRGSQARISSSEEHRCPQWQLHKLEVPSEPSQELSKYSGWQINKLTEFNGCKNVPKYFVVIFFQLFFIIFIIYSKVQCRPNTKEAIYPHISSLEPSEDNMTVHTGPLWLLSEHRASSGETLEYWSCFILLILVEIGEINPF